VRHVLDDHLACPALQRWLPELLGETACTWIAANARPSRSTRRLLSRWTAVPDDESALGALVLATPLQPRTALQIPATLLERVGVGSIIVDLAAVEGPGLATIWRPGRRRREVMLAVAERARQWTDRGLVDLEQWVSLVPTTTVVTMGSRGAHIR
jgi:hypothetical protein